MPDHYKRSEYLFISTQNDYRLRRDLRKYGDLLPKKGTFKDEERASRLLVTPKGSPLPEALIAFGSLTFSVWGEIHGFASQPRDWFAIVGAIYSFKEPPFFFTEESSSFNQVDKCLSIINNKTVILTDARGGRLTCASKSCRRGSRKPADIRSPGGSLRTRTTSRPGLCWSPPNARTPGQ